MPKLFDEGAVVCRVRSGEFGNAGRNIARGAGFNVLFSAERGNDFLDVRRFVIDRFVNDH